MKISDILKLLASPYSDKIKVDFRPLEYIEVQRDKPLIIKLNEKYLFRCELKSINDFLLFNDSKTMILKNLELLNSQGNSDVINRSKVTLFKMLIKILYEISKREYKGFIQKYKYYKFLNKFFFDDLETMYKVTDAVLRYNSRLKKKALEIQNFDIFQNVSLTTAGGQQLSDLLRTDPKTGKKYLIH